MSTTIRTDHRDLHACPRCGAHRWEQDQEMRERDTARCDECAHEVSRQDVYFGLVGRD